MSKTNTAKESGSREAPTVEGLRIAIAGATSELHLLGSLLDYCARDGDSDDWAFDVGSVNALSAALIRIADDLDEAIVIEAIAAVDARLVVQR